MTEELPTSIRVLRCVFTELSAPSANRLTGTHRAEFLGPRLLRIAAPRAIGLAGLPDWYGKRFDENLAGVNLLGRDLSRREALPMTARIEKSWLDGQPAAVITYERKAPRPWRWVRDEVRELDENRLLGLTFAVNRHSRMVAAPFLLIRQMP